MNAHSHALVFDDQNIENMFFWQSSSSWSRGFRLSLGVFNPTNRGCTRGDSCSYCHCDHPLAALNRRVRKRTRDKITRRLKHLLVPPVDLETFLLLRFKTFGFLGPLIFLCFVKKKNPISKNVTQFLETKMKDIFFHSFTLAAIPCIENLVKLVQGRDSWTATTWSCPPHIWTNNDPELPARPWPWPFFFVFRNITAAGKKFCSSKRSEGLLRRNSACRNFALNCAVRFSGVAQPFLIPLASALCSCLTQMNGLG